ncbi:MAG: TatD family hydrolase, partial [Elusimicrobiales bacterium]|nr:TatD family hydrolase [Elusimicrobiales bacterium]
MRFCDAHNHIHSLHPAETASALARAREADVAAMLVCATRPQDWPAVAKSAALYPEIIPFFGLHPWHAAGAAADWQQALERQLEEVPSGVGEIGLDRSKRAGDFGAQLAAFDFQLALAAKLDRPATIHCVRAWGPLLELLGKRRPRRFLLHSYGR